VLTRRVKHRVGDGGGNAYAMITAPMEFANDRRRPRAAHTERLARGWCMSGIENRYA